MGELRASSGQPCVLDDLPVPVWRLAATGACEFCNRAWLDLTGRDLEQELGDGWLENLHPEDVEAWRSCWNQAAAAGAPVELEFRVRRGDGGWRWMQATARPCASPTPERLAYLCAGHDVTASKLGEETLRRYRMLCENARDIVLYLDGSGRILDANTAAERAYGYGREELLRLTIQDLRAPGTHNEIASQMRLAGERGILFETLHRRRDGNVFPVEVSSQAVPAAAGGGLLSIVRDIRERRQSEQAFLRAHETMRALVEFSPLAIVGLDREGDVTSWNAAATRIFGWEESEVLGRPYPLIAEADHALFRERFERVCQGAPVLDEDVRRMTKDGRMVEFRAWAAPIRSAGELHGVVLVLMDVTERKQLEDQLRQAQRMEAIGCLAGGVAHDFNNLLTVINGHCHHVLEQMADCDPRREGLQEIAQAGERAAALVRQLLAFSRRQPLQPRITNLNTVVNGLKGMLVPLVGEDVELAVSLDPGLRNVKVDPLQIEQVIMNLVVNAKDAMPGGGKLTIRTGNVRLDEIYAEKHLEVSPGPYVMLAVSDNGAGMDAATKARIFEPFFTTKAPGRGTGLGLSTVYGIVQQSGGHITVASEPGRGSTFRVYLPLEEGAETVAPPQPAPAHRDGAESILLVEDELAVRTFLATVLQRSGYRVLEAANGPQALSMFDVERGSIPLLITDLVMPGMSGAELARRVEKLHPGIRVLYISGYTDHGVLDAERNPDVQEFLQKPFSPAELCARVRAVLDEPRPAG